MSHKQPLPDIHHPTTEPFWAGLKAHRLVVQRCARCRTLRYPSAPICPNCLRPGGDWTEIPSDGDLYSYVVYHRDLSGAFADELPYAVGMVELVDQLHVVARIDAPLGELSVGLPMEARFVEVASDITLLRWRLREGSGQHD